MEINQDKLLNEMKKLGHFRTVVNESMLIEQILQ